jgi:predicted transposase/invertase (TIGR01784 family)
MEALRYQKSVIETGWIEGHADGRAEGIAEGKAEGRAEGIAEGQNLEKRQIAANLKKQGLSIEIIANCTGLSPEEIANC